MSRLRPLWFITRGRVGPTITPRARLICIAVAMVVVITALELWNDPPTYLHGLRRIVTATLGWIHDHWLTASGLSAAAGVAAVVVTIGLWWIDRRHHRRAYPSVQLIAKHSGKVLDVTGMSTANGAPVLQYDWWGGDNQRWLLVPVGDGYFKLVAKHSGKVLDVAGMSTANGAPVLQYDWWGGDNQRWKPVSVGGDYFMLVAKHSGKVLDVRDMSTASGAPIQQYDWWGGDNQRWLVVTPGSPASGEQML